MSGHGTTARYWRGCRCLACRAALATYRAHQARLRAQGVAGRVHATVAWRLVRHLEREGWTRGRIGQALGRRWPKLNLGVQWVRASTLAKLRQLWESRA